MRRYAYFAILIGLLGILVSWSSLWSVEIVQDAFGIHMLLGWFTLSGFLLIAGGIVYLCWYELRGYLTVRTVDRLATAIQSGDIQSAQRESMYWLRKMHQDSLVESVCDAISLEEIRNILIPYIETLDTKVDVLIAKESLLAGALVGISPWAMVDGIVVAWRQLRMMRTIAALYGVRPSSIGTMRLLRRVLISVAFADASEHITQWIAAKVPSIGGLLPAAGQAAATAMLTIRLGRACKIASSPLQQSSRQSTPLFSKVKRFLASVCKKTATKEKTTRCSFNTTPPEIPPETEVHHRNMEPKIP
jgi:putative membrane protein